MRPLHVAIDDGWCDALALDGTRCGWVRTTWGANTPAVFVIRWSACSSSGSRWFGPYPKWHFLVPVPRHFPALRPPSLGFLACNLISSLGPRMASEARNACFSITGARNRPIPTLLPSETCTQTPLDRPKMLFRRDPDFADAPETAQNGGFRHHFATACVFADFRPSAR